MVHEGVSKPRIEIQKAQQELRPPTANILLSKNSNKDNITIQKIQEISGNFIDTSN